MKRYFSEHVMFKMREHHSGDYVLYAEAAACIEALDRENERLRDALEKIAARPEYRLPSAADIAKEALA